MRGRLRCRDGHEMSATPTIRPLNATAIARAANATADPALTPFSTPFVISARDNKIWIAPEFDPSKDATEEAGDEAKALPGSKKSKRTKGRSRSSKTKDRSGRSDGNSSSGRWMELTDGME